ncbi:hypothetical protein [Rubripirellula reticaptiva]|nr:hypothetical protein [Rubripirellula reticaptiva]
MHDHFDPKWKRLDATLDVAIQPEIVQQYETDHGELRVFASLNCRPTNQRSSVELFRSPTERGRWTGSVSVDRDSFAGRVDLAVTASATANGLAGRVVGSSDPWWIFVDEPNSLKVGGALRVAWVSFRAPEAPALAQQYPESTHVVELEGPVPVVYLNQDFEGLYALLQDRKDRAPVELALHDAHRYSIARSVWMALVLDSVMSVEPGEEESDANWPSKEWQSEVLKKVLPKIAPDKTDQELLNLAANDWKSGTSSAIFLGRAEAVVGEVVDSNAALRKSLHKLNRAGVFHDESKQTS